MPTVGCARERIMLASARLKLKDVAESAACNYGFVDVGVPSAFCPTAPHNNGRGAEKTMLFVVKITAIPAFRVCVGFTGDAGIESRQYQRDPGCFLRIFFETRPIRCCAVHGI